MTAATVKLLLPLLKVTPKRRDKKELWLAAAIFGSLAPLALYLPQLGPSDFCLVAALKYVKTYNYEICFGLSQLFPKGLCCNKSFNP